MAKKKISNNNYIKLGLILGGVILLTLVSANIYNNILTNKINNSYIAKYFSSIQYNEIKNAKLEFSDDVFLYVGYTGDKKIYNNEVKIKKLVEDNNLSDKFIYLNVKEQMEDKDYLAKLNETLELSDKTIKELPAIIYFKDNVVIEIIDSENGLLNSGSFLQLLEKYEIIS